jgi:hypothetical protein
MVESNSILGFRDPGIELDPSIREAKRAWAI